MNTKTPTENIKSFIFDLGVYLVGIADLTKLVNMPVGLKIDLKELFDKYRYVIVIGALKRENEKIWYQTW